MSRYRALVLALAAAALIAPYLDIVPGLTTALGAFIAFTAVTLIGLNLIFGLTGMLAFGQAAFVALPGYIGGVLAVLGTPVWISLPCGLALTLLIARVVAAIFVRLPGIFFAVGTLGFAFVVEGLARAFPTWTGGASGLVLPRPGFSMDTWYAISMAVLLVALGVYGWLARGAFFRTLSMIRHDELAAAAMGIDVSAVKVKVFTIGSCFSAVGGLFLAYYVGVLVPESAGVQRSLEQVGMLLLGGPGLLLGPLFGSAIINWLLSIAGYYGARYELLIYGLAFLGAVLYARQGVVGLLLGPWSRLTRGLRTAPENRAGLPAGVVAAAKSARPVVDQPCLEVSGLSKWFGGVQALSEIGFAVHPGEIFTLVGPNGAGKSTLFNVISGIERPTAGAIALCGCDIVDEPVHRRAPVIGRSFQVARLVPALSAAENVMVRLDQISPELTERERRALACEQLTGFGLGELADRPVRELSIGQHKLIDLARAAIGEPPVVLLDEPAVGLSPRELEHLAELLLELKQRGCGVIIVEHNIEFLITIAERGIVLDHGIIICEGDAKSIFNDPAVREAYFGVLA